VFKLPLGIAATLVLLTTASPVHAQTRVITGRVLSVGGDRPLAGAIVTVDGHPGLGA
jgi:hypothetical protein